MAKNHGLWCNRLMGKETKVLAGGEKSPEAVKYHRRGEKFTKEDVISRLRLLT
jgi:hypothetical protein